MAAAKKKKRRLWGDGSGRFRTKGKHSAATVVGTRWLVEDRCTSTLTRVVRGRVSVRDFVKKKTVIVRAGKKYVARAREVDRDVGAERRSQALRHWNGVRVWLVGVVAAVLMVCALPAAASAQLESTPPMTRRRLLRRSLR